MCSYKIYTVYKTEHKNVRMTKELSRDEIQHLTYHDSFDIVIHKNLLKDQTSTQNIASGGARDAPQTRVHMLEWCFCINACLCEFAAGTRLMLFVGDAVSISSSSTDGLQGKLKTMFVFKEEGFLCLDKRIQWLSTFTIGPKRWKIHLCTLIKSHVFS